MPDPATCLAAMRSHDARFDGRFVTAVRSTGIYCRPSCPALTPRVENVSFHPSAAAAQDAGYRACRRCRPDVSPGSPEWDARSDTVARAMRLVGDGVVDREGVAGLATHLGYSVRQLQRLTEAELGASPLTLARAQRAHTARVLLETTDLTMADVAFAAGFGSVRSFNDAVRTTYDLTPRALRERRGRRPTATESTHLLPVSLRLAFRRPFDPSNLFGHLVATAIPGVEEWALVEGTPRYRRTLRLPHGHGIAELSVPASDAAHVDARLWLTDPRDLTPAIARCRRLLDLDADPVAVDAHLCEHPALGPLVRATPGRRVPRTTDSDEFALRAVIGQQVSTAGARTRSAHLAQRHGQRIDDPAGGLTHLFPAPDLLTRLADDDLPGPATRRRTLELLAGALAEHRIELGPGADWQDARQRLAALPGIGAWTVEMVAMRSLGDPDAWPATDLLLRRAVTALGLTSEDAERWRPWRSYATQHLWATSAHAINTIPPLTGESLPIRVPPQPAAHA